jgi:hypothetical protein
MESYKHSCPFCGQHIEYTVEYCGKQMQCPMCQQTVTFPAIPPGRPNAPLRVKSLEKKPERKWTLKLPAPLAFLLDFQHWNVVAQCAVPFLIIGVLLGGAIFVKKKLGDAPTADAMPAMQADPEAWQRSIDLAKAEMVVKDRMKDVTVAQAYATAAEQARRRVEHEEAAEKKRAEEQAQQAQKNLTAARVRFDAALSNYRHLGGTIDYRSQIK